MNSHNMYVQLDILFLSNHNIHKSSLGLCFWASEPLIERFYFNISIKESEAQKQRPCELLWLLWFDEKSISKVLPIIKVQCTSSTHKLQQKSQTKVKSV